MLWDWDFAHFCGFGFLGRRGARRSLHLHSSESISNCVVGSFHRICEGMSTCQTLSKNATWWFSLLFFQTYLLALEAFVSWSWQIYLMIRSFLVSKSWCCAVKSSLLKIPIQVEKFKADLRLEKKNTCGFVLVRASFGGRKMSPAGKKCQNKRTQLFGGHFDHETFPSRKNFRDETKFCFCFRCYKSIMLKAWNLHNSNFKTKKEVIIDGLVTTKIYQRKHQQGSIMLDKWIFWE